ncbi:MAG TPA: hypothetical protein PLA16_06645 [Chitinophagales bacterium]|nr:hypothetical protein [Chitinophagales bacterium]HQO90223.1 hypothetical protein [Chitinophagales bacterium]
MKRIIVMAVAIVSIFTYACKKEETTPVSETAGLKKVQEMANDTNTVEIFTTSGALQLGYNDVYLRIRDNATSEYAKDAAFDWMPLMHMMSMTHACPKSQVQKVAGKETLYKGYLVFQMPENASERWTLQLKYQTGGNSFTVEDTVAVPNSTRKRVTVVTGTDSKKYIIALVSPETPQVAVNDFKVGLFTMENKMSFPVVKNFAIDIDPRMPSMGNHGSPNNENLSYQSADSLYHGKLSLTMTGYWKINMMLKNADSDVLKGEAVTEENEASSLFLEVEF